MNLYNIDMNKYKWYIKFNIINYNNFENNIKLIHLIDEYLINKKNIDNEYNAHWIKNLNNNICEIDYICETNYISETNYNFFYDYIKYQFSMVQNYIKKNYDIFGIDWYIKFEIIPDSNI